MKIAVSGSACTGKTTFGTGLARFLDIPFVPESFELLHELPQRDPSDDENTRHVAETYVQVLKSKQRLQQKYEKFVVDRSPLDLMNLWLSQGLGRFPTLTENFYKACRHQVAQFDFIVILPWGVLPVEPLYSESGKQLRNLNRWSLLQSQTAILGLARMWLRRRQLIVVPGTLNTVEARLEFVMARLGQTSPPVTN